MKVNNTDFISFLKREYRLSDSFSDPKILSDNERVGFIVESQKRIENNKELYNRTKLQKVLDTFISEAGEGKHGFIDSELIRKWQSANQAQKDEIINSFVRNHKKINLDWNNYAIEKLGIEQMSHWKTVLAFSIIFAVFLTSTIAVSSPELINGISAKETKVVNRLLGISTPPENLVLVKDIQKNELSEFIKNNSQQLRIPSYRDKKTISVDTADIRGKVAGVYEPGYEPSIIEVSAKTGLFAKASGLMGRLADKQIELSLRLNQKLKKLLE